MGTGGRRGGGELEVEALEHLGVLVIAGPAETEYLFQRRLSGAATRFGAVAVITAEAACDPAQCAGVMRHEVTHLLSRSLGSLAPLFKSEGLARWKDAEAHTEGS